jgi:type IV pilus assembly protein PilA
MDEKDQGFTLIELLVVIIIIGILAAIAIPVFLNQRKKGWDAQAKSDKHNLATLQESQLDTSGTYKVGADLASTKAAITDYKNSANVTDVVMKNYTDATATALGTTATAFGFCMEATSTSGNVFVYDSIKGGLLGIKPASGAPSC